VRRLPRLDGVERSPRLVVPTGGARALRGLHTDGTQERLTGITIAVSCLDGEDWPDGRRDDAGAVHLEPGGNLGSSERLSQRGCPSGGRGRGRSRRAGSDC
jgi:hypothetical protein